MMVFAQEMHIASPIRSFDANKEEIKFLINYLNFSEENRLEFIFNGLNLFIHSRITLKGLFDVGKLILCTNIL